ncbi:acylneuraminate cytidylyltransferase family protein [Vibrio sp. Isolate23]|uniref:acylneuraminate cytidylyltransferase family protein n=1 Tax=Vibrio sp. Isolate23 TaxID=2908533 RepID=UPI001EFD5BD1|nr:acylneuraminate cytidylyltransferase family protein [Vibrio sp. Isolate23]MCG9683934.1 acylneuraminate cytidylyltransferase family protein [Vibrio sp. Isolate23]
MKKVAFIPARGGSKGLPRKNVKSFLGEPLIARTIRVAEESGLFDLILVNTDDEEIAKIARNAGAEVIIRPVELGSDVAEVDPLMIWTIENYKIQYPILEDCLISLLYCTAPLRSPEDIKGTYQVMLQNNADTALSLCEASDYLWEKKGDFFSPTNYVPAKRAARQTEGWNQFKENKAVYFFSSKNLVESGCRIFGNVAAYLMPTSRSVDVDSLDDFILAEAIAKIS